MTLTKPNFEKVFTDAILPTMAHYDDAGVDFYIPNNTPKVHILPKQSAIIDTGIRWNPSFTEDGLSHDPGYINSGYSTARHIYSFLASFFKLTLVIQSRSGRAFKQALEASNAGVVDQGYRDPIKLKLYNNSNSEIVLESGEKVAQGLILMQPHISGVEVLEDSSRGNSGFGSSGHK